MQDVKNKKKHILFFLKSLWSKKIILHKNNKRIFGKLDFTFKKYRIVIFCDSEFQPTKLKKILIGTEMNAEFAQNARFVLGFWVKT